MTARDPTGVCVVLTGVEIGVTVGGERVAAAVGRGAEAVVVGDETGVCVAAGGAGETVSEGFFAPHAERMATLVAPAMKRKAVRRSSCREDRLARSSIVAQCTSLLSAATSDATLATQSKYRSRTQEYYRYSFECQRGTFEYRVHSNVSPPLVESQGRLISGGNGRFASLHIAREVGPGTDRLLPPASEVCVRPTPYHHQCDDDCVPIR